MAERRCDGCASPIRTPSGRENLWVLTGHSSGGLTLEFEGDRSYDLCFDCLDRLPDNATSQDVLALVRE